jgi:DNA primase
MRKEGMTFGEAVEFLAKRANIPIPQYRTADKSNRERLFNAIAQGHNYFRTMFKKDSSGARYLSSRGFGLNIAERFEIGYAPDSWDGFTKTVKANQRDLVTVGLLRPRESGGYYDYFRHRLMFPIKDLAGRVCAFGGRYLGEDVEPAKYLNSPDNPVYNKGSLLFGISLTREAIRKAGFVYLVEGYTDFLRMVSAGLENCAAGLGTAFTAEQAKLLHRYTEKAVLCYDGDEAGGKAAIRSGQIISAIGMEVEIVALPEEHDPDSFLRNFSQEDFNALPHLSLFGFQVRSFGGVPKSRMEREKLALEMLEGVAMMPSEMRRSLALEEIASILSIPAPALISEVRRLRKNRKEEEAEPNKAPTLIFTPAEMVERDLIRLLISYPEVSENILPNMNQDLLSHSALKKIFAVLKSLYLKDGLQNTHSIIDQFDDIAMKSFLAECAMFETPVDPMELIKDCRKKLEANVQNRAVEIIKLKIKEAQNLGQDTTDLVKQLWEVQSSKLKAQSDKK